MNEKIDKCLLNCIITNRGSLPMFRGYGLDVTDQNGGLRRSQIQEQLSIYFPDVKDLDIQRTSESTYKINVKGYYDETE